MDNVRTNPPSSVTLQKKPLKKLTVFYYYYAIAFWSFGKLITLFYINNIIVNVSWFTNTRVGVGGSKAKGSTKESKVWIATEPKVGTPPVDSSLCKKSLVIRIIQSTG